MKPQNVYLICRRHFNAAHRLHNPNFSDEKNIQVFGPCNNKMGHGHNYIIEVSIKGQIDPETGFVMNLVDLKGIVEKEIVQECDHKHLNHDVEWLTDVIPTAENLAVAFWDRLKDKFQGGVELHKIRLFETENNIVEYKGGR
jgi:6-pyruvoyltetrahydropterin/6-carboxytetrahydropterin synthase